MKKLILSIALLFMTSCAYAEHIDVGKYLDKIPNIKNGIAYSFIDNEINYLATINVLEYKGIDVGVGYAGRAENTGDKLVGTLTYHLGGLDRLGIDVPLASFIDVSIGIYGGYGRLELHDLSDSEWDMGLAATLLEVKF